MRFMFAYPQRGSGWIPLIGPKALSGVVRTPVIPSLDELRAKIEHLLELGSGGEGRAGRPDILIPFPESIDTHLSAAGAQIDYSQHRDTLAELETMGVTWVFTPGLGSNPDSNRVLSYLDTVGRCLITA